MITGSIVALATPMHDNGDIDWENLDRLVEFHIKEGTDAIVAVGTSGESATLNTKEHCAVMERVIKTVAGRIPVIAGTGANSTSEAIELTQEAKRLGADACLLVTPYYNKPTQEGLFLHHQAIAKAVDLGQILYNVPGRTAVDMLPETVARIAEIDQVIGIKEATGDLVRAKQVIDLVGNKIAVYSGDDETAYKLILLGGHGNISVTANVLPKKMAELCRLSLAGKVEEADALNAELMAMHHVMFLESNPIPVKWALHQMGRMTAGIRLPLTPLAEQYRKTMQDALSSFGLVK
ncbi:MAG: 4-hydroxy-tetrahydrodipicolinate synthase [Oleispira antarctica]|uniref:4-hydroxy-tetrahydrodipicolinate synthase n=1 Tax=Oleispira antarctica RB-8 TaxID=698738 RepID=R4YNV9_OLEAN|nr:4-hydroxy-tetrahydrodipicolinate synthase [Oleispira antarctica]MBQ0791994.1 4-hydroxy-tetrahydrodipicolinate synthase [Oleispira antarctica]CCK76702.1 Dihydrodipicolinate synthase. By similarity [Oleispira antarctica RB-8]|tara:strand:- start:2302 stop:3180 length:879 start_codon:yes stop_codon:yes gene_type:complete